MSVVNVALVLAFVVAAHAGDVLQFNAKNFDEKVKEHDLLLVKFFAPWCGHCKRIAPEFEKAATKLKDADPAVTLGEVDCDAEKELCQKYSVSGYPTLKIFRKGTLSGEYDGGRDADGIVKYMKAQSGPSSKELQTVEELEKFIDSDDFGIVGFFKEDSKLKDSFLKVADTERQNHRFAHTSNAEALSKYKFTDDIAAFQPKHLQNKFEKPYVTYDGNFDTDKIKKFLKSEIHGLCGHRKVDNADDFRRPLVVAYFDLDYEKNPKMTHYYRNRMMKVAKNYKTKVSFAISSKDDFGSEIESFGLTEKSTNKKPFVLILNDKGEKFIMEKDFSVENLKEFVDEFLAGKLPVHIKSEDIPEKNEGPVIVAVGKTFHDIVGQDKDVLIELYAPWCGHCKSLAPIYEDLAKKLKNEDNIVIAKMDATANEVPQKYSVSGFPTIYWAPKGKKDSPKLYSGGRTVDDFIKFISKEATEELNGWDRSGKAKTKAEL